MLVFLYDATFIARSYREAWQQRRGFYAALAATWSVLVWFQLIGFDEAAQDFTVRSPLAYALTQPRVMLHYLRLSVWPASLAIDYNWPTAEGAAAIVPAACVIGLLLAVTGWGLYRKQWFGFVGACFFLILAPSSSFVALAQNLVEHRMYLPLAAIVVLVVLAADCLLRGLLPAAVPRRVVGAVLVLAVAAALAARTHARNRDYHSAMALWAANAAVRPDSYGGLNNLGLEHAAEGEFSEAIRCYRQALRIAPDFVDAHNNLGAAVEAVGEPDEAIAHYRQALKIDDEYLPAHLNLARVLANQGRWDESIHHLRQSLNQFPDNPHAHFLLGRALTERQNPSEAVLHYRRTLELDADNWQAHLELGTLFLEHGQREMAVLHLRQAVQLKPDSDLARERLLMAEQG